MIVFLELIVASLFLVILFSLLWLMLQRSPLFTVTCEVLVDDNTAQAVSELTKARLDVDRELSVVKKRIKKDVSAAKVLSKVKQKELK